MLYFQPMPFETVAARRTVALAGSMPGSTFEIDAEGWTADADRKNNTVTFESGLLQEWRGPALDR